MVISCFNCNLRKIFTEERHIGMRKMADSGIISIAYLSKDVRGAPPESFIVRLSEIIGGFKSTQKMASFWGYVVVEVSNWLCFIPFILEEAVSF